LRPATHTSISLTDERVRIRDPYELDRGFVVAMADDERLFTHMMVRFTREEISAWFDSWLDELSTASRTYWPLMIDLDDEPAGFALLSTAIEEVAEVQWYVVPTRWGHGCATAATRLALPLMFDDLGFHRVFATADPDNLRSVQTLERAGFRCEGRVVDYVKTHRGWRDRLMFSLLDHEWAARAVPRL
jgi:RimJ/RimL family protein N-acetyltransferase